LCKISGFTFDDKELIEKMCAAISHREPDDPGRAEAYITCGVKPGDTAGEH